MKKITLIILQFCFVTLIVAQIHEFRLDGQILDSAYHNGKVVIQYKDGQFVNRKDSATASNGKLSSRIGNSNACNRGKYRNPK